MKLTDKEYRVLLAECASRIASGMANSTNQDPDKFVRGCIGIAGMILESCGIENEAVTDPSLRQP